MKTIEITLYQFEELSKEAQQNAINENLSINVFSGWWDNTYSDAETVGLNIMSFRLDRNKECELNFDGSGNDTADEIMQNHGENCDTYKLAKTYLKEWNDLVTKYSDGVNKNKVAEQNYRVFDDAADELEKEFKNDLSNEYASILQNEYEYLTSEEAIKQTILANKFDFTEEGKMY